MVGTLPALYLSKTDLTLVIPIFTPVLHTEPELPLKEWEAVKIYIQNQDQGWVRARTFEKGFTGGWGNMLTV